MSFGVAREGQVSGNEAPVFNIPRSLEQHIVCFGHPQITLDVVLARCLVTWLPQFL